MRGYILQWVVLHAFFVSLSFGYDWFTNPGTGDPNNPYQISTPEQLMSIGSNAELLDKCFILMNDIVFDPNNNPAHVFTSAVIAPDTISGSLVFDGTSFTGSLDGSGHIVKNLTIDTPGNKHYLGLFGKIEGFAAEVKDLGIENVNITVEFYTSNSGGLCGSNSNGTVYNCYSTGLVTGNNNVGGLCGKNDNGILYNCYSTGLVTGDNTVGNLCGYNTGTISNCYATGLVIGTGSNNNCIGGLCGGNTGTIRDCYSTGTVEGMDNYLVGGLVGSSSRFGIIINCYSSSSVSGKDLLGGLCGDIEYSTVSNCYATGTVKGVNNSWDLGGLCGSNEYGTISNCYAIGSVIGGVGSNHIGGFCGYSGGAFINCFSTGYVSGSNYLGGFLGGDEHGDSTFSNCFWNTQTSGITDGVGNREPDPSGVTGMDDQNMMIRESFVDWDFVGEDENGSNEIWRMCADGIDYPRLSWEYSKNGDFTCPDGVGIEDLEALTFGWLTADSDPDFNYACDGNGDGWIGQMDFTRLSQNWLVPYWSGPVMTVSKQQIDFLFEAGQANLRSQTFMITNAGSRVLEWAIESEEPMPGWLSMDPVSGSLGRGESEPVTLSVDISGLSVGLYEYAFNIVDPNALNSPQSVVINLSVLPSPAAYWALDETQGMIAYDSSGNDHHGMLVDFDDPNSSWTAGKVGNCLMFDGNDDRVDVIGYTGIGGGQSRTVCAWIRTTQLSGGILNYGNVGTGTRWIFFVNENGALQLGVSGGNITSTQVVADGQWHHIAAVLEAPAEGTTLVQHLRLYIDGQLAEGTHTNPNTEISTVLEFPVRIGVIEGPAGTLGSYFNGLIDEVCLYDVVLSAEQIALLAAE